MIGPVAKFIKYSAKEKGLIVEVLLNIWFSKVLLIFLPFKWIAPQLGTQDRESPKQLSVKDENCAKQISSIFKKIDPHLHLKNKCLVQAIAAKWMFKRRRIPSTLYLGARPGQEGEAHYRFHAWLRCGNLIVTGDKNISALKILSKFSTTAP